MKIMLNIYFIPKQVKTEEVLEWSFRSLDKFMENA